jgi:hypothetical protein
MAQGGSTHFQLGGHSRRLNAATSLPLFLHHRTITLPVGMSQKCPETELGRAPDKRKIEPEAEGAARDGPT